MAADISFGDLLTDSYRLAARLVDGFSPAGQRPQLLNVATDGENYGHHKKFGELALAHALTQVLPSKGFQLTNYAAFLALAPPKMEVELALGPGGRRQLLELRPRGGALEGELRLRNRRPAWLESALADPVTGILRFFE